MIKCKACQIFHDPRLNCKVAGNQLAAGTLPEPWLTANKLNGLIEKKSAEVRVGQANQVAAASISTTRETGRAVKGDSPASAPCPVCEARMAKERDRVKRWRLKRKKA